MPTSRIRVLFWNRAFIIIFIERTWGLFPDHRTYCFRRLFLERPIMVVTHPARRARTRQLRTNEGSLRAGSVSDGQMREQTISCGPIRVVTHPARRARMWESIALKHLCLCKIRLRFLFFAHDQIGISPVGVVQSIFGIEFNGFGVIGNGFVILFEA